MKPRTQIIAAAAGLGAGYLAWSLRPRTRLDLRGKVVLITGGSRGLGLQLAREFGSRGAMVAICARDASELDRAKQDLTARGVQSHAAVCDITDPLQVNSMVAAVVEQLGPVDVLVNNAGLIQVAPFSQMTVEDFERVMKVTFWGALYTSLAVLPAMRERRRGSIVNINSIGGKISVPHLLPYSCAKFAALALSEGLRTELAPAGIRVTSIVPGLMRTGSHLKAEFKGRYAQEYGWFSAGAATPLVSIGVERAARSIVDAAIRGDAQKILSVPAELLAHFHNALPEFTISVLSVVNRMLPSDDPAGGGNARTGAEIHSKLNSWIWERIIQSGQKAAADLNQLSTV